MSQNSPELPTTIPANEVHSGPGKRKKMFILLASAVAFIGSCYWGYWNFIGSRYVSTDNAYSAAEVASVTPSVAGIVSAVNVVDTQSVKAGDVLVVIDDSDARLALVQAEAELGRATRKVEGYFANDSGLAAQVQAREAEQRRSAAQLLSAQADMQRAELDLKRREALAKSGSVSGEELSNARTALLTAQANLRFAEAGRIQADANRQATLGAKKASTVLTAHSSLYDNPEVALARARRDQARLDLDRTVLRSPIDGVIARRQVQAGQRVQVGASLLSVVPVQHLHVDANFKEGQLAQVRVGQPVVLTADMYGSKVEYRGAVSGISGGSGSVFAVIPAQNATGNWIKVVQRVPVRIEINPTDLAAKPLSVGLSMEVEIDTRSAIATASGSANAANAGNTH